MDLGALLVVGILKTGMGVSFFVATLVVALEVILVVVVCCPGLDLGCVTFGAGRSVGFVFDKVLKVVVKSVDFLMVDVLSFLVVLLVMVMAFIRAGAVGLLFVAKFEIFESFVSVGLVAIALSDVVVIEVFLALSSFITGVNLISTTLTDVNKSRRARLVNFSGWRVVGTDIDFEADATSASIFFLVEIRVVA